MFKYLGITGAPACGKSYFSKMVVEVCKEYFIEVHHIDFDKLAHDIYVDDYMGVCYKIKEQWNGVVKVNNLNTWIQSATVDRKKLGEIVFNNPGCLSTLDDIMKEPMKCKIKETLKDKTGLILMDCALMAEHKLFDYCGGKCVVIDVPKEIQHKRLKERGLSDDFIENMLGSQLLSKGKMKRLVDNDVNVWYEDLYHKRKPTVQKLVIRNILRNLVFNEGDLL